MDNQRTQLFSRVLLTIAVLAITSPSLYYIFNTGLVLWGIGLFIVGIVLLYLIWFWRPS